MTFVSLVLIQFFKAYNFRSDRHSVLHKPFANKWLNMAVFWEIALAPADCLSAFSSRAIQYIQLAIGRLGNCAKLGCDDRTCTGTGKMAGTKRLVRQA